MQLPRAGYTDLLNTGLLAVIATVLLGDANHDGLVTGLDLIAVQENFGSTGVAPGLVGDANDDGLVTGLDLITVQENFGKTLTPGAVPVPEPALAVVIGVVFALRRSCVA